MDDNELAEIEKELCRVPAVNAARIVADDIGRAKEVHILATSGKSPKQIDLTMQTGPDKGQKYLGIYELDGDTLKLCFFEDDLRAKKRPTAFAGAKEPRTTILVLQRGTK